jgi:large-conductance mechanosensitive channel
MSEFNNQVGNQINELKKFVIDNNIVGTVAGVCVALSAKDAIQSLVGDIIIPIIVILLRMLHIDFLTKYLPVSGNAQLKITDFIKEMITFILIIIISFVFVKIAFGALLGIDYRKSGSNISSTSGTNNTITAATVASASSSNKEKYTNFSEVYNQQNYDNM